MTRHAAAVRLSLAGIALAGITSGCSGESDDQAPKLDGRCEMPRDLASLPAPSPVYSRSSPAIDYFSPRAADLDADGELEIVATGGSESPPHGEVVALDGPSGDLLWRVDADEQLYSSAVFVDVTGDGVKDVFVGGRNQTFFGVDGASGERLWTFVDPRGPLPEYYLYNFYTPVPIDDLTGDGVQELLVSNGGSDAIREPGAPRPPGHLVVIDAKTGGLVALATSPDHEEMYMSPLLVPDAETSSPAILFGTGGETRSGGLWRTTLDDVLAGDISTAKRLVDVAGKGVIAPPALADLDGDDQLDIIVATFDGRLIALNGANDETLWELVFDAAETFSTPALGYFDDDEVPDVFAVFLHGVFPAYDSVERVIVSGDGSVLWRGEAGTFTMAGDVALDLDGDDRDEVVFSSSDWNAEPGTENTLHLVDTVSSSERPWGMPLGSPSQSSPWVGDLDADGCLDLVVATHTPKAETNEASLERFRVAAPIPARISWGGYLGTRFDSILQKKP